MAFWSTKYLLLVSVIAVVAVLLGRFNLKWTDPPSNTNTESPTLSDVADSQLSKKYTSIHTIERTDRQNADTTVVILNWSRLDNVIQIVKEHCSFALHRVIASVYVWNNNPLVTITVKVRPTDLYSVLLERLIM